MFRGFPRSCLGLIQIYFNGAKRISKRCTCDIQNLRQSGRLYLHSGSKHNEPVPVHQCLPSSDRSRHHADPSTLPAVPQTRPVRETDWPGFVPIPVLRLNSLLRNANSDIGQVVLLRRKIQYRSLNTRSRQRL